MLSSEPTSAVINRRKVGASCQSVFLLGDLLTPTGTSPGVAFLFVPFLTGVLVGVGFVFEGAMLIDDRLFLKIDYSVRYYSDARCIVKHVLMQHAHLTACYYLQLAGYLFVMVARVTPKSRMNCQKKMARSEGVQGEVSSQM